jgi:tripartite-type tricarboxylate transporter receptor subunit TctC
MQRRSIAIAAAMVLLGGTAWAEAYPERTITMIVPFAAGGPTDTVARLIAEPMTRTLDQQVIVENVGGAGGTLGAGRVAKADPDGYTLLLHHIGQATSASLYRKLAYDPATAFTAVGLVTDVPMTIVAKNDLEPGSVGELLEWVKTKKDEVTLANAGIGSASHLCGLLFLKAIETPITTVPYKGTGPAMNDLLGGQVDFMCDQTANTLSHIKADKIKVFGVTSKDRIAQLPDTPTLNEAGLPGFELNIWYGLYAPKGTPRPVIDKLSATLQGVLKDDKLKARFAQFGAEPVSSDRAQPEPLRAHVKAEIDKWGPIIKAAGVYAE